MGFMKWNDSYKIGVDAMDKQHQKWLSILNDFYDNMDDKKITDNMIKMLDEAIRYTLFHFKEEEAYMTRIGYPKLVDQKKKHAEIAGKLKGYKDQLSSGKTVMSVAVTSEMKKWFNEHITNDDKAYGQYAAKK